MRAILEIFCRFLMKKASFFAFFDQKTTFLEFLTGQKRPQHFFYQSQNLIFVPKVRIEKHWSHANASKCAYPPANRTTGVKSEWLNGLESVLIQIIENERRVQPRITQYFKQGQSSQSTPTVESLVTTMIITIQIIQMTVKYTLFELHKCSVFSNSSITRNCRFSKESRFSKVWAADQKLY